MNSMGDFIREAAMCGARHAIATVAQSALTCADIQAGIMNDKAGANALRAFAASLADSLKSPGAMAALQAELEKYRTAAPTDDAAGRKPETNAGGEP